MQNWAKRSVRAALVTGGVLAVGTSGVASAEDGSDQPTLGDGQLTWDEVRQAGSSFTQPGSAVTRISGTLDSERDLLPAVENEVTREFPAITAGGPATDGSTLTSGNTVTGGNPVVSGSTAAPARAASSAPRHRLHEPVPASAAETLVLPRIDAVEPPADEAAAPEASAADTAVRPGQHRREVAQQAERAAEAAPTAAEITRPLPTVGSPARGVYRSMSWTGPIGDVVRGGDSTARTAGSGDPVLAEPLITPSEEIVYADGFEDFGRPAQSVSLAGHDALRAEAAPSDAAPSDAVPSEEAQDGTARSAGSTAQPARTTASDARTAAAAPAASPAGGLLGGLLDPSGQDLTTADLSRATKLHPVPHAVLNRALATTAPRSATPSEPRTLTVPGEYQDRADELPGLRGLDKVPRATATSDRAATNRAATNRAATNRASSNSTAPLRGMIESALSGTLPRGTSPSGADGSAGTVRFSPEPALSEVSVATLDELTAGMPERDWIARNPFPTRRALPAMPELGMALPTFSAPPDTGQQSPGQNDETLVMPGQRV
ncbi:hypothetical protein [Bounagaea algeriensis]